MVGILVGFRIGLWFSLKGLDWRICWYFCYGVGGVGLKFIGMIWSVMVWIWVIVVMILVLELGVIGGVELEGVGGMWEGIELELVEIRVGVWLFGCRIVSSS